MYDLLVGPWTWGDWMWRGMLAAVLVSVPCSLLGVFLYLRRMSLLSDALAHVALPGIVLAFMWSGSLATPVLLLGAVLIGLVASFMIEGLSRHPNVRPDAAIGIVFTVFFAIGVILLSSAVRDAHIDTDCTLFGNILGISDVTLSMLGIVAPVIVVLVFVFYRWLAVTSFDESLALSLGVPVTLVHYGLMTSVSVTTVASFEAVGAVLVIAFIIVPAATAHLFADRLSSMLGIAVAHGLFSSLIGMYASVWLNCSSAGAIVVAGGTIYALSFLFAPRHGVLSSYRSKRGQPRGEGATPDPADLEYEGEPAAGE